MSLLNYADYQQLKMGVNCAPGVLRGIAHSIDGQGEPEPDTAEPEPEPVIPATAEQAEHDAAIMAADDDGEPGSAKDHWASTTHVRRSTHGHRRTSSAAGKPERAADE